jgi:hypothetical protein
VAAGQGGAPAAIAIFMPLNCLDNDSPNTNFLKNAINAHHF